MLIEIVFYCFAVLAIFGAWMVVTARNPVKAVLALVFTFVMSAGVWMTTQAEFLALSLIVVYVGAVMVLFLFVVMMLDVDVAALKAGVARYLPIGLLVVLPIVALMIWQVGPEHFGTSLFGHKPVVHGADYSNTKALGELLYTRYVYEFILAAAILLVAMMAAICLAFRGPRSARTQHPGKQVKVQPSERLRVVKMKSEKKTTGKSDE
ncbi:NADH-quinone oxidoreductase subunit J [Piscirickettsia salmonis]|uniref:NADH-quinone oxidoreductase subunit J n=1 Tax=Piscirickettsia salmonis TaxID=1238 RepID=UPI0012BA2890|nr:NADH-quinone oxidoreductase subunit J [Piscirickettsia salmonis]QGP51803.1 NADH-quinone oxidoreductase subunit J [Piscirickettsia salmonis]QGP52955.1 NADH-quinone oxidoreductase subunit J [Piscirickettsia salmonis]QGP61114.1 NADH-quinone oxidoreductase subunit J [Piscirickettsia salmonis]QGP62527.1 NADH-quinone oxidoreductase subunit J [Piscirickettsia salmonis]